MGSKRIVDEATRAAEEQAEKVVKAVLRVALTPGKIVL